MLCRRKQLPEPHRPPPPPHHLLPLPDHAPKYPLALRVRLHKHVVEFPATEPHIVLHLDKVPEPADRPQVLHHIVPRHDPVVEVHPQELRVLHQPPDLEPHCVHQELHLPLHVLRGVQDRPGLGGEHPQRVPPRQPARVQEFHQPPGGDGGAERAVGEDLVFDRLPAPELRQELEEAGRLAGVHGEEQVRIRRQGSLDLVAREAEAGEFLEEAAQAVVGAWDREAAEDGGGLRGGEASGAMEELVQATAGGGLGGGSAVWVLLGCRGLDGGGGGGGVV
uniref:Uncharacterized protein n=1 Tax=Arundo donax TaxID=35708 RepID=A0A0A9GAX6_ARUDO